MASESSKQVYDLSPMMTAREELMEMREKCEQYWNSPNQLCVEEMHSVLEFIHVRTFGCARLIDATEEALAHINQWESKRGKYEDLDNGRRALERALEGNDDS